jgi:hypothetical protein
MNTTLRRVVLATLWLCLCVIEAAAQAPVIDSFTPTSGFVGTSVTMSGSNFSPIAGENIVYFGAVRATVTAATAHSLVAAAPAGATYQPLKVTTAGLTAASQAPFIVTFPSSRELQFDGSGDFSTGSLQPREVRLGDLDGDGKADMIAVSTFPNGNGNTVGGFLLFHNTSTAGTVDQGSFGQAIPLYPSSPGASFSPGSAAVVDLDGDGKLDLVLTEDGLGVVLYRNISTPGSLNAASFAPSVMINVSSLLGLSQSLGVADLDGDGRPEIIVCRSGSLSVLRNLSSPGTLDSSSFAGPVDFLTNQTVYSIITADFDRDGKIDIASLSGASVNAVTLLRNISSGPGINSTIFAEPVVLGLPPNSLEPVVGDLDGDGRLDIATASSAGENRTITILRNLTSGPGLTTNSFAPRVEISEAANGAAAIRMADMDGDGKVDLVLVTAANLSNVRGSYSVFINNSLPGLISSNSFALPRQFLVSSEYTPYYLNLADMDGDGKMDVILSRSANNGGNPTQGNVSVYHNGAQPPANFPPAISIDSPANGAIYSAPAEIPITATASDSDGSIASVGFFSGTTLLGTVSNAPYAFTWTNVAVGAYTLSAKVTDDLGAVTTSSGVTVTVNPIPELPTISGQPQSRSIELGSNVTFTITAAGTAPLNYQWFFNGDLLPGATASNLVFSSVQFSNAGQYSVVVTNIAGSVTSSPALLTVLPTGGRLVHVLSASGSPGSSVDIPIELLGQGNENAVTFSLLFPPALSYASAHLGSGAAEAILNVNDSEAAAGRLGISLALSADHTLSTGTQEIVVVTFNVASGIGNTTAAISFGAQPLSPEISDTSANVLTASYLGGIVTIVGGGYEGDVTPPPDGNGTVSVTDWIKIGRYAAKLDNIPSPSQFQRADCAPRSTLGNGAITTTDWVQAGRYAAGLDPLTAAGGPTGSGNGFAPRKGLQAKLAPSSSTARDVRIPKMRLRPGQTNVVPVLLLAQGDESALGFSINFDPSLLTFVSANTGANATGAVLNVNISQAPAGQIGMVMTLPIGNGTNTFPAGTQEVVLLRFTAPANALGVTAVTFGNQPAVSEVSDSLANSLTANFVGGTLQVEPTLKISRALSSNVLAWPTWASNGLLEATSALPAAPPWHPPTVTATNQVNGEIRMTVPSTPAATFFRLRFP